MATILVTGRNGFVGCAIVEHFKKYHKIISVIRSFKKNIDYTHEEVILKDLLDLKAEDLKHFKCDLILHLAAQIRGIPKRIFKNNLESSKNIFQIAESLNYPVIFLSSTNALYQDALGAYAQSKSACEDVLKQASIDYLIIRVPLILGTNSSTVKRIRSFYQKFCFFPLFGKQEGKVRPIPIGVLKDIVSSQIGQPILGKQIITVIGRQIYTYKEIIENVISSKKKVFFIRVPFVIALFLAQSFEKMDLAFFVSAEEIKSVNTDKIAENSGLENFQIADNSKESLVL